MEPAFDRIVREHQREERSTDPVFDRIDRELKRQERNWAWLARELDVSRAAVGKWKSEGVPKGRYDEIAVALRQTYDWIAGRAEARAVKVEDLSPMAIRLAQEFDRIKDDRAQLEAFATCLQAITRAAG